MNTIHITVAKKSSETTFVATYLQEGISSLNIDDTRVGTGGQWQWIQKRGHGWNGFNDAGEGSEYKANTQGRFPANLILSNVEEFFPESAGQQGDVKGTEPSSLTDNCYGEYEGRVESRKRNDSGSAARFFKTLEKKLPNQNPNPQD